MPGFLSRYFPRKRLDRFSKPTWVDIRGTVANARTVRSLLTDLEAAAFRVSWVEGRSTDGGKHDSGGTRFTNVIASAWTGQDLIVQCGDHTISAPLPRLKLRAHFDPADATPLTFHMPPEFEYLLSQNRSGALYFREHAIYPGDPVRLKALVRAVPRGGGYREVAQPMREADFAVVGGSDATLQDLSTGEG